MITSRIRAFFDTISSLYEPSPPYPQPAGNEEAMRQILYGVGENFWRAIEIYEQEKDEDQAPQARAEDS